MRPLLAALALAALAAGCLQAQTEFHGSAFFPGGVKNCRAVCARDGLEMSSYIYTGRFATSCVCRPAPPPSPPPSPAGASQPTSSDARSGSGGQRRASADPAEEEEDADVAAAIARIEAMRRRDPRQPHAPAPGSE